MRTRKMVKLLSSFSSIVIAAGVALGTCDCAQAAIVVNLTGTGSEDGEIDGAVFTRDTQVKAGTGVFGTFVMIQAQGNDTIEKGYNSSARKLLFDENNSIHTHDLQAGDIPIVKWKDKDYFEFLLDINEPNNEKSDNEKSDNEKSDNEKSDNEKSDNEKSNEESKTVDSFISLDVVKIYSSSSSFAPGPDPNVPGDLGTLRYDMDRLGVSNEVLLDYGVFSKGSGWSDMRLLVPIWTGASPNEFVYLYSEFGAKGVVDGEPYRVDGKAHFGAQAGFEEWATGGGHLPEPAAAAIWFVLGVLGLGATWRRRHGAT